MKVVSANIRVTPVATTLFCKSHGTLNTLSFPLFRHPLPFQSVSQKNVNIGWFAKKSTQFEPVSREPIIEEVEDMEEEDAGGIEEGTTIDGDDYFEDGLDEVGDGGGGGGIMLSGTWWEKAALAIAEDVVSFDGDLKLYAFKTSRNSTIQVRIEKLSNKYGSPSMDDIEAFSSAYRACLDEAEHAGSVPENIYLEVSSPGIERVVRIPHELDRFKDLPMYVKYVSEESATGSFEEHDGVFKLNSIDLDSSYCTWSLADVRLNRESTGKGRPLSKKQRDWQLQTHFDSLQMVRLYSDV